jgi:uncharacterized protein (TIGR00369 family)
MEMSDAERKLYMDQVSKLAENTFWGFLGCQLESLTPQKAEISLQAETQHLNLIGIVHGGVLSSLLDNAMGVLVMSILPQAKIVTTNLNVHFVAPMQPGRLIVSAELVHQSRKMLTVYGTITDGEGKLGTIGTGTFRIISGD